eukprot:474234_1
MKEGTLEGEELEDVEFKIFVGIDFGTDGCGLAYAVKSNANPNDQQENTLNVDNINGNGNGIHIQSRKLSETKDSLPKIITQKNKLSIDRQSEGCCTLNILEILAHLHGDNINVPSIELIDNALSISSVYTNETFLGIIDILSTVT